MGYYDRLCDAADVEAVLKIAKEENERRKLCFEKKYGTLKDCLKNRELSVFGTGRLGTDVTESLLENGYTIKHIFEGRVDRIHQKITKTTRGGRFPLL